jgi:DNA-binding PadR family transcriptional regulator
VSSIRIFILGSLVERGPMHGHQLRLLAEEEHVHLWTDITVGALYGAIKRLVSEGLLEDVRTEREGHYPERQVLGVTDAGRAALSALVQDALSAIVVKPDPFDLAFSRLDPARLDELPATVAGRLGTLQAMLAATEVRHHEIRQYLTVAERVILTHKVERLRAEISWHTSLLLELPSIIADESARKVPS